MAFRVRYDPVQAIGELAQLAGEAPIIRRQEEMAFRAAETSKEYQQRYKMAQLEGDLRRQTEGQAVQWEYEKMGLRSQHDFALAEQRHEFKILDTINRERQLGLKRQTKHDKIDELLSNNNITRSEANQMHTQVDMGFRPPAKKSGLEEMMAGLMTGGAASAGPAVAPGGTRGNVPTAEDLRRINTPEAYNIGTQLGYWK